MKSREIWKSIEGYHGLYMISSKGAVKSLSRIIDNGRRSCKSEEIILKNGWNNCGYVTIVLSKNGKGKTFLVHRIVASHFLSNTTGKFVDHIDGDRKNNNVENLEWVTTSENNKRASRRLLKYGNQVKTAKLNVFQVLTAMTLKSSNKMNLKSIANLYKVDCATIGLICRGKNWSQLGLGNYKEIRRYGLDKKEG